MVSASLSKVNRNSILSAEEAAALDECETEISMHIQDMRNSAKNLGSVLAEIRDKRLYREHFKSFQSYCQERWNIDRSYADRQINHHTTIETVSDLLPIGGNLAEAASREIASLPPEQQREVIAQAVKESPRKAPTAKIVREAKQRIQHASIVRDKFGQPVPESLRDEAEQAAAIQSVARKYKQLFDEVVTLSRQAGGQSLARHISDIELATRDIQEQIKQTAFASQCPRCKGQVRLKCGYCYGNGFIDVATVNRLAQADREWLETGGVPR